MFSDQLRSSRVSTGVLLVAVTLATLVYAAPPAAASVNLSVEPMFPTSVIAGQTNVPASLTVTNNSTLVEAVGTVAITSLRLVPSCSNPADAGCDNPGSISDPGTFTLGSLGAGRAGTACAGQSFNIVPTPGSTTGEFTFQPAEGSLVLNPPLLINDLNQCAIDFAFSVNRAPNHDAAPAVAGTQTSQVGFADGMHWIGLPGQGTGADITTVTTPILRRTVADFNGNGSTDHAVWRPPSGQWFVKDQFTRSWGLTGDVPVPGDYDGNGTADVAIWRPSTGQWFVADQPATSWGLSEDIPVPGDYNGNGTTDFAVWRPSTGQWFVFGQPAVSWGLTGDIPVPADYNGDRSADIAVWRPSTGQWFVRNQSTTSWGLSQDIPVPGDYDGNGSADVAVWRPSTGQWYVIGGSVVSWGLPGDIPVQGDYDANGSTDRAVFRNGQWFMQNSGTSVFYGLSGDFPAPLPPPIYMRFFR